MSGSFSQTDYNKQTDFALDFVESFSNKGANFDGEKYLKIGVVGFASTAVSFTGDGGYAKPDGSSPNSLPMLSSDYAVVKAAIKKKRTTGGTRTNLCFNQAGIAFDLLNPDECTAFAETCGGSSGKGTTKTWNPHANNQGARANVPKIILLMTDGTPNNAPQSLAASKAAQAAGITILGVGVAVPGNGDDAIKLLVSDPKDDHYVSVDNANALDTKLAEIVKNVRNIFLANLFSILFL